MICHGSASYSLEEKMHAAGLEQIGQLFMDTLNLRIHSMKIFKELFHVEHLNAQRGNFWEFKPKKGPLKWRKTGFYCKRGTLQQKGGSTDRRAVFEGKRRG